MQKVNRERESQTFASRNPRFDAENIFEIVHSMDFGVYRVFNEITLINSWKSLKNILTEANRFVGLKRYMKT